MSESKPAAECTAQSVVISRRTVFAGAGAVGALGVMAAASKLPTAAAPSVLVSELASAKAGGYQLTDHVKQYYASARI